MTKLLQRIELSTNHGTRTIDLCQGDLCELEPDQHVDILVISTFPNDYMRTPSSLVGQLYDKGVNVGALAMDKAVDLRESSSCWLSHRVPATYPGIQFDRLLVFEPPDRGAAPEVVSDIFRALSPFLGSRYDIQAVAMPVVASGDQGNPVEIMLPPLLEAAIHWLGEGLPLQSLKIFVRDDAEAHVAGEIFREAKSRLSLAGTRAGAHFDVFVSYSSQNEDAGKAVTDYLRSNGLEVFFGPRSVEVGKPWPEQLFTALAGCEQLVALLSPAYLRSKCCQDEFNIAWARRYKENRETIYPIYWQTADLPPHMTLLQHVDSREGSFEMLTAACSGLVHGPAGS